MVSVKIGRVFEVEFNGLQSVFLRVGGWGRYFNRNGLPSH